MSDPAPQFGLSKEELLSIQKALRESCEAYSAKEKANTLTRADYDSWQACLKEYEVIDIELAELRENDRCYREDIRTWTQIDTSEKEDGDWVVVDRK